MPKSAIITLSSAGTNTGPFNLLSDVDSFVSPFESNIPRASLIAGYTTNLVPDAATIIRVKSNGACTNFIDLTYPGSPTTTTTTTTSTTTTTTTATPTTTSTTTTTTTVGSECVRLVLQGGIEEEYLNCGIFNRYDLYTAYYYVNCTASSAPQNINIYFTASGVPSGEIIYTLTIPSGSHYGTETVFTRIWTGDCENRESTTYTITEGPISPAYASCSCATYNTTAFNISIGNTIGVGGTCNLARDTVVFSMAPNTAGASGYTFYIDQAMTTPFIGSPTDEYALSWSGAPATVRIVEINGSGLATNVSNCY